MESRRENENVKTSKRLNILIGTKQLFQNRPEKTFNESLETEIKH